MAASDNNKEYLDQVYYAMGNIHLAAQDTLAAINATSKVIRRLQETVLRKAYYYSTSVISTGLKSALEMLNVAMMRLSDCLTRTAKTMNNSLNAQRYWMS